MLKGTFFIRTHEIKKHIFLYEEKNGKLQFEMEFFCSVAATAKMKEKPIGCETEHEKSRATSHM